MTAERAEGAVEQLRLRERLARLARCRCSRGARRLGRAGAARAADRADRPEPTDEEIWQLGRARAPPDRPYTLDYVERMFDDFVELHGDRALRRRPRDRRRPRPLPTAARSRSSGTRRAATSSERTHRNFGMAYPEGYRKAMRVMELADRHGVPDRDARRHAGRLPGRRRRAARPGRRDRPLRSSRWLRLGVPTVACVIGEGGSGGAVAIAVADRVLMLENAIYSVISPEGCAAILWRDASEAKKAAAAFKPDARHCLELGVIDGIVPEPEGGAHERPRRGGAAAREALGAALDGAGGRRPDERRRAPAREVPHDGRLHSPDGRSARFHSIHRVFRAPSENLSETGLEAGIAPVSSANPPVVGREVARASPLAARLLPGTSRACPSKHGRRVGHTPWPGSTSTGASATAKKTPEPFGGKRRRRSSRSSSSSATTRAGCTTTSGSSATARSRAGPCRRACRSSRASGPRGARRGPPARVRDLRGRDPARASTAPARSRSGTAAPTSCSRRSRRRADRPARTASGCRASGRSSRRSSTARRRTGSCIRKRDDGAALRRARAAPSYAPMLATLADDGSRAARAGSSRSSGTATARSRTCAAARPSCVSRNEQRPHGALRRGRARRCRGRSRRRTASSTARSARSTSRGGRASPRMQQGERHRSSTTSSTCSSSRASRSSTCRWRERRERLERAARPAQHARCGSPRRSRTATALLEAAKRAGARGRDGQAADSRYEPGQARARDWLKVKTRAAPGVPDRRVHHGRRAGASSGLGSLVLAVRRGRRARAGSGNVRHGLHRGRDRPAARSSCGRSSARRRRSPSSRRCPASAEDDVVWVEPKLVCEVEFAEWTHDGRLRAPVLPGPARRQGARGGAARAAGRDEVIRRGQARRCGSRTSTRSSGPTRGSRRATCSTTTATSRPCSSRTCATGRSR